MTSFIRPAAVFEQIHAQQLTPLVKDASKSIETIPVDPMQQAKRLANSQSTRVLTHEVAADETKKAKSKRVWLKQLIISQSAVSSTRLCAHRR